MNQNNNLLYKLYELIKLNRLLSIRIKFMGIVVLMVLLLGYSNHYVITKNLSNLIEEQLLQHARSLGENLSAIVADPVLTNNLYELHNIIDRTIRDDIHVRYIFILDTNNNIVVSSLPEQLPKGLREINETVNNEISIKRLQTDEGIIWDLAAPIADGLAGTLRIAITDEYRVLGIKQVTKNIIISSFVIMFISLILAYLLTRLLTKSLFTLYNFTKQLGQGKYDILIKPDIWAGKEINSLNSAFYEMVKNLKTLREKEENAQKARKNLLQKTINAQEDERKRIARELHDEANQHLAAINYGLDNLRHINDIDRIKAEAQELKVLVKEASDSLRALAWELRPKLLDEFGLVLAMKKYLEYLRVQYGLMISFTSNVDSIPVPHTHKISIYRIVQEALINIIKHANAKKIEVAIQKSKENIIITIDDDGIGFDHYDKESLGIYGMHERATLIGGKLNINSNVGEGTTVLLSLEINVEEIE
ncbi:hypothetical protein BHU72_07385 [Desulfuribacillus stibiiarsenatis]|uniref:histidine kinase n=1 Tax=Desulfuribacillus stibiiarsenatis TaxID=1390249 RepID=A0A1E5L4E0_9FIRM|nr:sensor histidine kinase [Desulfuribacillus stibiiarsenatis]OEH85002.1 hypothetical protein BHU72_07385 [Desulfuribacillus stibiiarsenatis]